MRWGAMRPKEGFNFAERDECDHLVAVHAPPMKWVEASESDLANVGLS